MRGIPLKLFFCYFLLPLLVFGIALISLCVGEIPLSPGKMIEYLNTPESMEYGILHFIRIPRTLLAIAIGGSLSLSGVILQGIYRNLLVEPYTLGISGGASLGITFAIISGLFVLTPWALPASGFAGAFVTIFLVYYLCLKQGSIRVDRMLLIGVMCSFISSSLVMFLMSITAVENIQGIIFWTMGSLNESDPYLIRGMVIVAFMGLFFSYLFVAPLNTLRLGEEKARHLGINTQIVIRLLFLLTSLLTGCCIAVGGVIGFVGLIIPHITRLWAGNDYRILLAASFWSGGIFMMFCDLLARTVTAPNELPIGVITGILGGFTFILILSRPKLKSKLF